MPRLPRLHEPGTVYHVISRGNDRQSIFLADEDFEYFRKLLANSRARMGCRFYAYCLMTNHFHLLFRSELVSISRVMHYILTTYARRFNLKFSRCGHVFENRFTAIPCRNERYFLALLRYIHLNPVRAGIAKVAGDWEWSGHRELIGETPNNLLERRLPLSLFDSDERQAKLDYLAFLGQRADEGVDELECSTTHAQGLEVSEDGEIHDSRIETTEEIAEAVALEWGISLEDIRSRKRARSISAARRAIASRCWKNGVPVGKMAKFLGCSPAAISQMLKT